MSGFSRQNKTLVRCVLVLLASAYAQDTPDTLDFTWPEDDASLNCVVGIAANDKPVSVGVFITSTLVLTSSNPLLAYKPSQIHVYSVYNESNVAYKHEVVCAVHLYRDGDWIDVPSSSDSPVHDLAILRISKNSSLLEIAKYSSKDKAPFAVRIQNRKKPFYRLVANSSKEEETYETAPGAPEYLTSAGFAFTDRAHVQKSLDLEFITHSADDMVDCDSYLPRLWGSFLCILDTEGYVGVQSGQPLFKDKELVGIGSFTVQKGKEVVYVFTMLALYADSLPKKCDEA